MVNMSVKMEQFNEGLSNASANPYTFSRFSVETVTFILHGSHPCPPFGWILAARNYNHLGDLLLVSLMGQICTDFTNMFVFIKSVQ
jgi:hypothetical protein